MQQSPNWIQIILSSVIISALVNQVFSFLNDKLKSENEKYKALYGPLRFYFILTKTINKQIDQVIDATDATIKDHMQVLDLQKQQESVEKSVQSSTEIKNKLVESWWKNINKIF